MIIITVLIIVAGKTMEANNAKNPPSISPIRNNVTLKKIEPLIIVPTAVNIGATIVVRTLFFSNKNKLKKISAVIGLSMIFAICPPGAAVVKADINPVTNDNIST